MTNKNPLQEADENILDALITDEAPTPVEDPVEDPAEDGAEEASGPSADGPLTPLEVTRRAVQWLLGKGVISKDRRPDFYKAFLDNTEHAQSILDELGFSYKADQDHGYIVLLLPVDEDDDNPQPHPMVRRTPLTVLDSVIALILLEQFRDREVSDEDKVYITMDELFDELNESFMYVDSDRIRKGNVLASLRRFSDWKIIEKVRGQEGRYEITPVIRIVIKPDWVDGLRREFESYSQGNAPKDDLINEEQSSD